MDSDVEKEFEDEWLNNAAPITTDDVALMEKALEEVHEAASSSSFPPRVR